MGTSGNWVRSSALLRKKWTKQSMKFTIRAMKTSPSAQPLGFFDLSACEHAQADVELRCIGRRRNAAAIGLINLIYPPAELRAGNLARYESRFRIGTAIPI